MSSLAINLTVIFGVRLISSQLFNLVLPYYLRYYFKSAERHKDGTTPPELEFLRIKVWFHLSIRANDLIIVGKFYLWNKLITLF